MILFPLDLQTEVELLGLISFSSVFGFLRNICAILHRGCTSSYSHPQYKKSSVVHLSSLVFLMTAVQIDVRSYLSGVVSCVFLMISCVEHFFMYLLAICMPPSEKYLLSSFAHVFTRLFVFLLLSCRRFLPILDIYLYTIYMIIYCYSHAFRGTDSLRRTMQIVKCSLLRQWAQGSLLLAKDPDQHL